MQSHTKVYAFIDSQNINLGVKSLGWILDFKKFRIFLKDKYKVERAFLFLGYIKENKKMYEYLNKIGYEIVFKPSVKYMKEGKAKIKGNVDIELAMTVMLEIKNFRSAIIASGDGDFYTLIKYLKENSKLLKVIVPNNLYSSLLKEFSLYIVNIEPLRRILRKE
jgi:uncharacterized LabA/DUF88 family protein